MCKLLTTECCWANRGYVIVAWIWSILFYLGLDPIKWAMAWAMNEDGFRTRTLNRRRQQPPPEVRPGMCAAATSQDGLVASGKQAWLLYAGCSGPLMMSKCSKWCPDAGML